MAKRAIGTLPALVKTLRFPKRSSEKICLTKETGFYRRVTNVKSDRKPGFFSGWVNSQLRLLMNFLRLARAVVRPILNAIAYIDIVGLENIPDTGAAIVASNHLGRLDALLAVILSDREDFVIMVAEKYQKYWFWRWVMGELDALWLNRYEADFNTLKIVIKRMKQGQILGIAPEGTRSKTESLLEAKEGAAYLASKTDAAVIPIAIWGTEDRAVVKRLLHLRKLVVHVRIGRAFTLPPAPRGKARSAYLHTQTDELMCRIAAMLPPTYRGFYADNPRVPELVTQMLKNGEVITS